MEKEQEQDCCGTQLIDGNGVLNEEGLENFTRATNLRECGLSYACVAIMGPQSSGKSTIMNHLFQTDFKEMDARRGRNQTTKGIWIAKCKGIEPFTIAMDLEGTDSRERGEVLSTVPTPLECLEPVLRDDIEKIWGEVAKPEAHKSTPLSEFFDVEVAALSSYEEKEEQFKEQVAELRPRISDSFSKESRLAGDRQRDVPASAFPFSLQNIWQIVKENKDLDLPAHKVMVATVRCEEIANEKLKRLTSDEDWLAWEEAVKAGPVSGFGEKLSSILETHLSEYDKESIYFDDGVRNAKRQQLELNALDVVRHAYATMLSHLRSKALRSFKIRLKRSLSEGGGFAESVRICKQSCISDFDQGCEDLLCLLIQLLVYPTLPDAAIRQANSDGSEVREKLVCDIETIKQLTDELSGPVESLLETAEKDTWASLRKLVKLKTKNAVSEFSTAVASFELDGSKIDRMVQTLRTDGRNVVEKKQEKKQGKFTWVFNHDNDARPRVWTGKENIRTITKDALSEAVKILSVMAAIRLDKKPDNIEKVLFSLLMDETVPSSRDRSNEAARDPLASSTWEEISTNDTLLTPAKCKSLWGQFEAETKYVVTQAISSQAAVFRWSTWVPVAVDIALEVAGVAGRSLEEDDKDKPSPLVGQKLCQTIKSNIPRKRVECMMLRKFKENELSWLIAQRNRHS
ncbi:unnamed protein product [Dovyalis caffra]|uniref:GB1/RHD3-type G domain-containing protein n=1 Tax=Dovyalis caffra TaxID=77055 RepID=A0AAV1RND0_9ROSI|nr:unnamed protein product [Dovyalis caffra]